MRYLRPFMTFIDNFKEELQDFCEMNLAYLLDDGKLLIEYSIRDLIRVQLSFDREKEWDEIKDHMIPFLIRLTNKYEVVEKNTKNVDVYIFTLRNSGGVKTEYRIKDLIDDKIKPSSIIDIRLFVSRDASILKYYELQKSI